MKYLGAKNQSPWIQRQLLVRENKSCGSLHHRNFPIIYQKQYTALWILSPNRILVYPIPVIVTLNYREISFLHFKQRIHLLKRWLQVNPNQTTDITGYWLHGLKVLLQSQSLLLLKITLWAHDSASKVRQGSKHPLKGPMIWFGCSESG